METREMKISEYVDAFVSKSPVLGGGGVSAVVGALAAAAGEMVCALTTGKEKYAGIEPEIRGIEKRLNEAGTKLLELADKDAEAFEPLAAAYKASDISEEEMDMLYEQAASVPLEETEKGSKDEKKDDAKEEKKGGKKGEKKEEKDLICI